MIQIIQMATSVATPLAFIGLVVALVYYAYTRRLKHAETKLQLLPLDERATAVDEYLTRYGIHGKDLEAADKVSLIQSEMDKCHQRSIALLFLAAFVFVVCFSLAVIAYVYNSTPDSSELINELENRANVVIKTINDKKQYLESMKEEGVPVQDQLNILTEATDRFSLLHREYISSLRQSEFRLSHERLAKVKEFLGDQQLSNALGVVYKPVYSVRERLNENGETEVMKTKAYVPELTADGEKIKGSYFASVDSEVMADLPSDLAIPE